MRVEACERNPSGLTNVIEVLWRRCLRQVQQCRYIKQKSKERRRKKNKEIDVLLLAVI